MRIKHAIFVGSLAALVSLMTPALAKNFDVQKTTGEQSTSSPCSAQQRTADGTWIQLPCRELGIPTQSSSKSATRSSEHQTR